MNRIIKSFLIIFFVLIAFHFKSNAEVVKEIDIQGNERISPETIILYGDISKGKDYNSSDINDLIKKLYETSFFLNISVKLINGKLNVIVEENPVINSIIFDGEKADKYKEVILERVSLREKTSFIKANVKGDINLIKEFYRQLGYYFVKIELEVEELKNNRLNLRYVIEKGDKAKIAKIFFLGEKKIRDNKLRNIITSQEAKFWKFISRNVYLNQSRIDLDKRLLKNYYKKKGYYEIDITTSNVEYSEGEGFILSYIINAGKRYKFKKIQADVAKELDSNAFA